jgi:hypothetical protein
VRREAPLSGNGILICTVYASRLCVEVGEGGYDRRERGGDWADGPARASAVLCAGRTRFLGSLGLSVVPAGRQNGLRSSALLCLFYLASPVRAARHDPACFFSSFPPDTSESSRIITYIQVRHFPYRRPLRSSGLGCWTGGGKSQCTPKTN